MVHLDYCRLIDQACDQLASFPPWFNLFPLDILGHSDPSLSLTLGHCYWFVLLS
jgi:hypothetical protein